MTQKLLSRSNKLLITLGLVLPLGFIVIPAILAYRAEREVKDSFRWVTHTLEVERAVQSLVNSLVDAETGQRGFLLTQRAVYLEPYDAGRSRIAQQLKEVRNLTGDNPEQQRRLDQIDPLVRDRLAVLEETIALERRGEHDAALALVNSDRGKNTMDKIRGLLREMGDDEQRLLWIRQRHLSKQAGRSTSLLMMLLVASGTSAGLVFYLVRRLAKAQRVAS